MRGFIFTGIWHFAAAHGLHGLSEAVKRFILRNWPAIVTCGGDEFLNLDAIVLEQLLESSKLCVESEIQVMQKIVNVSMYRCKVMCIISQKIIRL